MNVILVFIERQVASQGGLFFAFEELEEGSRNVRHDFELQVESSLSIICQRMFNF
jgi:hypothetical protein